MSDWFPHICDQAPPLGNLMILRKNGRCEIGRAEKFNWVIPKSDEDIVRYRYL